ncbi:microsomal triglyceride transfer protein large subunit-like [Elgaria multicarinata webbii]|uniref:microsomal triglyceride transfer protein large subunit-like n=1 Tax=Elgaria multicarinata webbii TaxID=159646 RepID=UPI002FCD2F36
MNSQALSRYCWLLFYSFATAAKENRETPSFQSGIVYQYRYSLDGHLHYLSRLPLQGSKLQVEALVDVQLLWRNANDAGEQLLQVQIHDLQVSHDLEQRQNETVKSDRAVKTSLNATELQQPVFLHWSNGKVKGIYEDKAGSPLTLELKRGLVSLFQFQTHIGTVTEEDISGSCQVTYVVSENSVLKTKDLHSCIRPKFGFSSINEIFGVLWQPTSKTHYSMEGSLIKSALSEESHILSLTLKSSIGVNITSRQHLELVSQMPGSKELPQKSLQEVLAAALGKPQPINIASEPSKRICTECQKLKTYLKTLSEQVKMDLSEASTTWHFCTVVQMLRDAKKRDILTLLKKAPEDTVPFYVEAAVAAQSTASLAALSEFLNVRNKKQAPLLEKFLYAAAFSPRPSKELLRMVLDKLSGKKLETAIWETGNIVIGSVIGKLCRMQLCGLQEVRLQMETVLQKLKSTRKDSEKVIYLLSLKNALLPESIPTFLHYAEEGSASVSATAVTALQQYSTQHISSTVKMAMKRIFHQVRQRYQKISRVAAAEILLDNDPSPMDFINVLLTTRELEPEMAQFLLSKIQGILHSREHPTRQVIKDVLKDPQINNYYFLSPKVGSSISCSGPLAVTNDTLSTFSLDLLFSDFGILRKSITSFNIRSHRGHQLQAAQVAIEAKGLGSVLGGDAADEQEDFMAGMSAVLLDVQLRPVAFFEGYTDLMSKVLTSSGEPTNVVKGNVLLMDHQQAIPLQSGLQAVITLQGGLGLDVSADINVNLWEQEFITGIETRGAMTIDFQAELDAPFYQATLQSQTEVELATNFYTTARLSISPVHMCLRLTEDQVSYRENFLVSESSANQNSTVRKGRGTTIPGREFALYPANSEMCKILLAET